MDRLSENVISAYSINSFKNNIDKYLRENERHYWVTTQSLYYLTMVPFFLSSSIGIFGIYSGSSACKFPEFIQNSIGEDPENKDGLFYGFRPLSLEASLVNRVWPHPVSYPVSLRPWNAGDTREMRLTWKVCKSRNNCKL